MSLEKGQNHLSPRVSACNNPMSFRPGGFGFGCFKIKGCFGYKSLGVKGLDFWGSGFGGGLHHFRGCRPRMGSPMTAVSVKLAKKSGFWGRACT